MQTDYHISFNYQGKNYDLDLVEGKPSKFSLEIGQKNYGLLGNESILEKSSQILSSLNLETDFSEAILKEKIQTYPGISSVSVSRQTDLLGKTVLGIAPSPGLWFRAEIEEGAEERQLIGEAYWNKYQNSDDHKALQDFIKQRVLGDSSALSEAFTFALKNNKKEEFVKLFDHFSRSQLDSFEGLFGLEVLAMRDFVDDMKIEDLEQLRTYMQDSGITGVAKITTPKVSSPIISTENIPDSNAAFPIFSLGKVFTGVLMMQMIKKGIVPESALSKPILTQLEPEVLKKLETKEMEAVRKQLEKTPLHQVMIHEGGLRDYLGNYQASIQGALAANETPPVINKPEDLLQYADGSVGETGKFHYSNLGLLLVGLTIQYHYNKDKIPDKKKSFGDILRKYIIKPAKLTSFSEIRPENAYYKTKDPNAYAYGGPAGGDWLSVEDLDKFSQWLCKKYQKEEKNKKSLEPNSLHQVLEKYGQEFYEGGVITHTGASAGTGSAHITTFLNRGVSVAIISDKDQIGRQPAAQHLEYVIIHNLLTKKEET